MGWDFSRTLVHGLRWVYQWTGWRPTDETFVKLGHQYDRLHCFPSATRDGRTLYLDLRNPVSIPYLLEGDFPPEQAETHLVRQLVRRGQTAVDIGANVGWYASLLCNEVGPEGRVVAFEPNPHLAKLLRRMIDQFPHLDVREAAVSQQPGRADFHMPDNWISGSLAAGDGACATTSVRLERLDDVLDGQSADFVKLDAEGAEVDVLRGAGLLLDAPDAPFWLVELSSEEAAAFGRSPTEVVEMFADARTHYTPYAIDEKKLRLCPLEIPEDGPYWMNVLFVPDRRADRLPEQWLSADGASSEGSYIKDD